MNKYTTCRSRELWEVPLAASALQYVTRERYSDNWHHLWLSIKQYTFYRQLFLQKQNHFFKVLFLKSCVFDFLLQRNIIKNWLKDNIYQQAFPACIMFSFGVDHMIIQACDLGMHALQTEVALTNTKLRAKTTFALLQAESDVLFQALGPCVEISIKSWEVETPRSNYSYSRSVVQYAIYWICAMEFLPCPPGVT